jgi:hypothetical protein
MPTFDIDLDIEDMVSNLNSMESQDLVDELYDYGYIPTKLQPYANVKNVTVRDSLGIQHDEFLEAIDSLEADYLNLKPETIQLIIELAKVK